MEKSKVIKAQAAIEFLMTYGWVLLSVVMVIGALAYFGVFDVSRFIPDKCEISSGFECVDYKIAENAIILQIKNSAGTDFYISRLNYSRNNEPLCNWTGAFPMANGDVHQFTTFCLIGRDSAKQTIKLELEYYKSPLSRHLAMGELTYKVEGVQTGLGDEEICQRAQVGGLCCALDFYFGPGTMNDCCIAPDPQGYCCGATC